MDPNIQARVNIPTYEHKHGSWCPSQGQRDKSVRLEHLDSSGPQQKTDREGAPEPGAAREYDQGPHTGPWSAPPSQGHGQPVLPRGPAFLIINGKRSERQHTLSSTLDVSAHGSQPTGVLPSHTTLVSTVKPSLAPPMIKSSNALKTDSHKFKNRT